MKILIDNGHGQETPGKRSPDGKVREWLITRDIAHLLKELAEAEGFEAVLITPETADISLRERCRRANGYGRDAVLISIHLNAQGSDGKWHEAQGFSAFVSLNASESSKRLARLLTTEAIKMGLRGNRSVPPCRYWVQDLAMCRDTKIPAVLTENLFQDNEQDCAMLLNHEWRLRIARLHLEAIKKYVNGE